jgi:hypothetical protein
VAFTNLSLQVSGLTSQTQYFFTFRATNAVSTLWAAKDLTFTTLGSPVPPPPVLQASGVTVSGGVPSFNFTAAAGCKYRLDYKNSLTDTNWVAGPWSTNSTGNPISIILTDPSALGQPQRFYRLETASP